MPPIATSPLNDWLNFDDCEFSPLQRLNFNLHPDINIDSDNNNDNTAAYLGYHPSTDDSPPYGSPNAYYVYPLEKNISANVLLLPNLSPSDDSTSTSPPTSSHGTKTLLLTPIARSPSSPSAHRAAFNNFFDIALKELSENDIGSSNFEDEDTDDILRSTPLIHHYNWQLSPFKDSLTSSYSSYISPVIHASTCSSSPPPLPPVAAETGYVTSQATILPRTPKKAKGFNPIGKNKIILDHHHTTPPRPFANIQPPSTRTKSSVTRLLYSSALSVSGATATPRAQSISGLFSPGSPLTPLSQDRVSDVHDDLGSQNTSSKTSRKLDKPCVAAKRKRTELDELDSNSNSAPNTYTLMPKRLCSYTQPFRLLRSSARLRNHPLKDDSDRTKMKIGSPGPEIDVAPQPSCTTENESQDTDTNPNSNGIDGPLSIHTNRDFSACTPRIITISERFPLLYRRFPASSFFQQSPTTCPCASFGVPHPGGTYNHPRWSLDLYTPRFVKGKGSEKVGLCPICVEPRVRGGEGKKVWLAMKFSAFKCLLVAESQVMVCSLTNNLYLRSYHMQYAHGISASTGLPYSPPVDFRVNPRPNAGKNERKQVHEAKCHKCSQWIAMEGVKAVDMKVREIFWWKHAAACHHASRIENERDAYEDDDVYDFYKTAAACSA